MPLFRACAYFIAFTVFWDMAAIASSKNLGEHSFALTILHINDHHSHLEARPLVLDIDAVLPGDVSGRRLRLDHGGFPLLTSLFESRSRGQDAVLRLHAGDAITGTLYYTLFGGEADAALMNQICFDAFAVGNHEFDHGDKGLARFLEYLAQGPCNTSVLAANVVPHDSSPLRGRLRPSVIIHRAGQRIGVVGLVIAEKTKASSSPDPGTAFRDELSSAQLEIDKLRLEGVNKIVLLTHYQYGSDRVLARSLRGVDVIVGGDSHTLLGDEKDLRSLDLSPDGPYPTIEVNADGDPVCVVQAFEYARAMGELKVVFDSAGRVIRCVGGPKIPVDVSGVDQGIKDALQLHPVLFPVVPSPQSAELLEVFQSKLAELRQAVVGQAGEHLCLVRLPGDERKGSACSRADVYAQGSHITALVAQSFLAREAGADIAIQNAGGVRGDIPAGPITVADAFSLLPYANTLYVLSLSGEEIVEALELAVSDPGSIIRSFPYSAGLRFGVDLSAMPGKRIRQVEVNPRLAGGWSPIDLARRYSVVTNSFIANGGDGYAVFARAKAEGRGRDTYAEYAQSFVDFVRSRAASGNPITRPAPEQMSTRSFVDASGCDHALRDDC